MLGCWKKEQWQLFLKGSLRKASQNQGVRQSHLYKCRKTTNSCRVKFCAQVWAIHFKSHDICLIKVAALWLHHAFWKTLLVQNGWKSSPSLGWMARSREFTHRSCNVFFRNPKSNRYMNLSFRKVENIYKHTNNLTYNDNMTYEHIDILAYQKFGTSTDFQNGRFFFKRLIFFFENPKANPPAFHAPTKAKDPLTCSFPRSLGK